MSPKTANPGGCCCGDGTPLYCVSIDSNGDYHAGRADIGSFTSGSGGFGEIAEGIGFCTDIDVDVANEYFFTSGAVPGPLNQVVAVRGSTINNPFNPAAIINTAATSGSAAPFLQSGTPVAVDPVSQHLYLAFNSQFADAPSALASAGIWRFDYNGGSQTTVYSQTNTEGAPTQLISGIVGMAVDATNGRLIWSEVSGSTASPLYSIKTSDLSGGGAATLYSSADFFIGQLDCDETEQKIFFVGPVGGAPNVSVQSIGYEDSSPSAIWTPTSLYPLYSVDGLAVLPARKIIAVSVKSSTVGGAPISTYGLDYDGGQIGDPISAGSINTFGLSFGR